MTRPLPVGCRVRCGYREAHRGTVLADDDPRAWAGSLAFPVDAPDPVAVAAHVAACQERGLLADGRQPVLWEFGRVYWDRDLRRVRD